MKITERTMDFRRTPLEFVVTRVLDLTPTVRKTVLHVKPDHDFQFEAGQFVMLQVPGHEKKIQRAYSIASREQDRRELELLFKAVPGGLATEYVWKLNEGDSVFMTGPFGKVTLRKPPAPKNFFLCTGSGISQHYSFLISHLPDFPTSKYQLLFGVRSEAEIFYQPELEELQKNFSQFRYEFVLSRPSDAWTGKKGYIQNFLRDFSFHPEDSHFYLCGNGQMIKDVKEKLTEAGFEKQQIMAEAFD